MQVQIPTFNNAKVLVVGDLMLDRYWHGPTSRISPEAPVPVVHVSEIEERPGGAANVALNIAALGAQSTVLGVTGDDDAARALEQKLKSAGVSAHFIKLKDNHTVTKLRVMSRHQQLIRLDFEDGFIGQDISALEKNFSDLLDQHDIVVCSDYGKGCLRNVQALIAMCRDRNIPVLVDPKGNDFSKYAGASLITPNMTEFEGIVGHCENDDVLVEKAEQLRAEFDLGALLITRSEHGMSLFEKDVAANHMPTRARDVYDVTGAGDTVISTLAASLAAGQTLPQSTALANLAAGIVVAKSGTASVTVDELRQVNRENFRVERGVLDEAALMRAIQACREHNERIIMTNGCFDILHAGHVAYLQQASELGDRLVVAVNIDETVRRLKGPERPVNSVEYRMSMLAALECVDWVVAFTEDEPTRLICELMPDVLVKGGDNDPDIIPGGDCVRKAGGEVKVLSYLDGVSTTKIIESIKVKS